jgi:FixJ family two-component response regulator
MVQFLRTLRSRIAMGTNDKPVIAIVDDDESLRRSVRNLLLSVGFRVETFASAEAFLLSSRRDQIECLILDLRMSGMSGLELLRAQAMGRPIPTIVLTGHASEEARKRCLQAGALAFLPKPVAADVLLAAVKAGIAAGQ